jgi:hypothetical protein
MQIGPRLIQKEVGMTDNDQTTLDGEVTHIFAHRFVVQTKTGSALADLGPKGAERFALRKGEKVTLSGEMKPSELKVHTIRKEGGAAVAIEHKKPHSEPPHANDPHDADRKHAVATARANGFVVVGSPRRKPKHFEILGKDSAGDFVELHVELGGALRKTRPVENADPKWAVEMRN